MAAVSRDLAEDDWGNLRIDFRKKCGRHLFKLQAVALNEGLRCKKRLWREGSRQHAGVLPAGAVSEPMSSQSVGVTGPTKSN